VTEIRAGEASPKSQEEHGAPPRGLGVGALAEDALIYGGARVVLKSLAFLLVPLYAHFLAPADFGVLELVLAIVAFIDVLTWTASLPASISSGTTPPGDGRSSRSTF
jgi:hypothetical protein